MFLVRKGFPSWQAYPWKGEGGGIIFFILGQLMKFSIMKNLCGLLFIAPVFSECPYAPTVQQYDRSYTNQNIFNYHGTRSVTTPSEVDYAAVKTDIVALLTNSQEFWPAGLNFTYILYPFSSVNICRFWKLRTLLHSSSLALRR